MDLLPPSAFECKRSEDPWKELARTTGELIHLRLENQQLKKDNKPTLPILDVKEEFRARVDVHKSGPSTDTSRHLDELIQRQAAEIAVLKQDVRTLETDHKAEIAGLEKDIAFKDRQYSQTVASLEAEIKSKKESYENQVDRLSVAHQEEIEDLTRRLERVTANLEDEKVSNNQQVTDLQSRLTSLTQTSHTTTVELQQELRQKEGYIHELESQTSKLKKYIGDCEKGPNSEEVWKKEKESIKRKQVELETERESLLSTIQLLNVRLSAANDILGLQERELSKGKVESVDKTKLESLLLTRWREKVFALLIQQKSADIVSKKDFQNWKEKLRNMEAMLDSYRNQIEVLNCTLSDRDAQLEIERNKIKVQQEELTSAQQIAIALDDQLTQHKQQVDHTNNALYNFSQFFLSIEGTTNTSLENLKAYDQRISFATGRLEMLQAQFARKEAYLRLQIEEGRKTPAERETGTTLDRSISPPPPHLNEELAAVTRERDTLAAQLRHDSQAMEARMATCRQQVESEVNSLRSTVVSLESSLEERTQKCCSLSDDIERLEKELVDREESLENLKVELGKQQLTAQQAWSSREEDLRSEFAEKFADVERQMSEAKREHAKAVVSLRQLQRQSTRDRERAGETTKLSEEHYTRQIQQLQQQLHAVEKERNVLMTTLRQEGLLNQVKLQRGDPALMESPEEPVSEVTEQVVPPSDQPLSARSGKSADPEEPLSAVLEDIESLTAAVMGDEQDSDSD